MRNDRFVRRLRTADNHVFVERIDPVSTTCLVDLMRWSTSPQPGFEMPGTTHRITTHGKEQNCASRFLRPAVARPVLEHRSKKGGSPFRSRMVSHFITAHCCSACLALLLLLPTLLFSQERLQEMDYWPTHGWRPGKPAAFGLSQPRLAEARTFSEDKATDALLVIRHGYIVAEWYFEGYKRGQLHESTSMAKSVTSILVGIALDEGKIRSVGQPAAEYFPEWLQAADPHNRISIVHLLSMTSGLNWDSQEDTQRMKAGSNWLSYALERPVAVSPGTRWLYSNGDATLLSGIVRKATGASLFDYGREKLFRPLNLRRIKWGHDGSGTTDGGSGIEATARDYSKIGLLYLKRGRWEKQQIVSESWVNLSTRTSPVAKDYAYLWWRFPEGPPALENAFYAHGARGQYLLVIPKLDMVVTRLGRSSPEVNRKYFPRLVELILQSVEKGSAAVVLPR